jgi:tetratricopeptide (TPR) repeat protein
MKARFVIALLALATLCVCAIAQENTAEDWYEKGRDLGRNGSYEEAVKAYDKAIELEPGNATFYIAKVPSLITLTFITNNQSKRNESMEAIDKALEIDPKNPRAWELKGSVLSQAKKYNESLEAYDKAIENISSYKQDIHVNQTEFLSYIWTSKSISLWQLLRYNESLEAVDKAVQIDPAGNYDAWAFKGELLASLGRYNESLQAFEGAAATETASSQPEIRSLPWAAEGYVLMQMGRYEEADLIYQKIISLNFTSEGADRRLSNAWRGRGNALAKLRDYNESLQAFDKAIELNAEMAPYAWTGKGDALRDASRYDEAIQAYDESLKLYPEYADAGIARAWKGKGDVLIKTDRLDEALEAYDKAVVAYDEASMAFNNATPIDKAVSFTFDPYPLDGEFWYDRGYALWSLDRDAEANSAFEKSWSLGHRAPEHTSPTDSLSITNVTSLGEEEFIELTYTGNETQSFKNLRLISENGSIVLPDFALEPGENIRIHFGQGETNETDLFLNSEITLDDVAGNLTLKDQVTGVERFMAYWTRTPADYWMKKAEELSTNGSFEEAVLAIDRAIEIEPQNATL